MLEERALVGSRGVVEDGADDLAGADGGDGVVDLGEGPHLRDLGGEIERAAGATRSTITGKSRGTSTVPLRLPTMRRLRNSALTSNDARSRQAAGCRPARSCRRGR